MRNPHLAMLIWVLALLQTTHGQEVRDEWTIADLNTRRLSPKAFQLPENVSQYLLARGCTVPQTYPDTYRGGKPHNVIRGAFEKPGQLDWAILCSRDRFSSILVFWGGSTERVAEIGGSPDKAWLQGIGEGAIGFSRQIDVVGEKYIIDHYRAYGGPKPPPIDHEGIDDAFVGKASGVHYYYRGKWLRLTGAD